MKSPSSQQSGNSKEMSSKAGTYSSPQNIKIRNIYRLYFHDSEITSLPPFVPVNGGTKAGRQQKNMSEPVTKEGIKEPTYV